MLSTLRDIPSAQHFEALCQALLSEEFQRFQAFSSPDRGMDAYESDTATIFQVYFPEGEPLKKKIRTDLAKARMHGNLCKHWVLLIPKNPTPGLLQWLNEVERPVCGFSIEVWGATEILRLLRKHPQVREQFFPDVLRKEIKRIAMGRRPGSGDAAEGRSISEEQAAELRDLLIKLTEVEAVRKRRRPLNRDFQREYGEFNAHFCLSSYDRLSREKFTEARAYLERKLYARRASEPRVQTRHRLISGIKAIQKQLSMTDVAYRELIFQVAGKRSTTELDIDELQRTLAAFRQRQGLIP